MFTLHVPNEILTHCNKLIQEVNFGNRGVADGNKFEQLTGIIGQCLTQRLLGVPLINFESKFDGGVDIIYENIKIDIKTMGRSCEPKPNYVNNLIGLQKNFDVDVYIFCSLNKINNNLTFCGWISKSSFFSNASLYKKDSLRYRADGTFFKTKADLFEIENFKLNQIVSADDLIVQLRNFKK
jgi:hypothetical protein